MSQTMRLFIAVPLPELVKQRLLKAANEMGQRLPPKAVRWVKPEQMHLTLRFLGETAVTRLPHLQIQLDQLTQQQPSFNVALDDVGAFPNRKRPGVLWVGLVGEVVTLHRLKADLDARLLALGWEKEKRPFSPHLTLGRVKDSRSVKSLNWDVAVERLEWRVTAVELIQSELRPFGAIYTVKHVANFEE